MGCSNSVSMADEPRKSSISHPTWDIKLASDSLTYSCAVAAASGSTRHMIYDIRSKAAFLTESTRGAVWGWEKLALTGAKLSTRKVDKAVKNRDSINVHGKKVDELDRTQLLRLLQKELLNKHVLVLCPPSRKAHMRTFLRSLSESDGLPAGVAVTTNDPDHIKKRYGVGFTTCLEAEIPPCEMIPPFKVKKVLYGAVFVCGTSLTYLQPFVDEFEITQIIFLVENPDAIKDDLIATDYHILTPDENGVTRASVIIAQARLQQTAVLLVDDNKGCGLACVACVKHLVTQGVDPELCIQSLAWRIPDLEPCRPLLETMYPIKDGFPI